MSIKPPRDLWAVVCADGRVHYGQRPAGIYRSTAHVDDAPIDGGDEDDDAALSDESVDCAGGPHRVVRYVAAPAAPAPKTDAAEEFAPAPAAPPSADGRAR